MKTLIRTIISALTLSLFVVSTSFAQSTGTVQDAQSDDTYTQDTQTGQQGQQDDRYTTQDGMQTQDYGQNQGQTGQTEQQDKTQIAQEELPSDVTNAIDEGQYSDWTVAEAYEVNGERNQEETVYEIHFENEQGQTEKERFKENGQVAR